VHSTLIVDVLVLNLSVSSSQSSDVETALDINLLTTAFIWGGGGGGDREACDDNTSSLPNKIKLFKESVITANYLVSCSLCAELKP
jgi:hypothetical protein